MIDKSYTISMTTSAAVAQFQPLKLVTGAVLPVTTNTEKVFGYALASADSGDEVTVVVQGVSYAIVDGSGTAIAVGDELMCGSGKLIKDTAATGKITVSKALDASTKDGEAIRVLVYSGYQHTNA